MSKAVLEPTVNDTSSAGSCSPTGSAVDCSSPGFAVACSAGGSVKPTVEMDSLDGVPNYGEIIADLFRRRDLNPLNYTTVRNQVDFPVVPSNMDIAWKERSI